MKSLSCLTFDNIYCLSPVVNDLCQLFRNFKNDLFCYKSPEMDTTDTNKTFLQYPEVVYFQPKYKNNNNLTTNRHT